MNYKDKGSGIRYEVCGVRFFELKFNTFSSLYKLFDAALKLTFAVSVCMPTLAAK